MKGCRKAASHRIIGKEVRRRGGLARRGACFRSRRTSAGARLSSGVERSGRIFGREVPRRGRLARRAACFRSRRTSAGAGSLAVWSAATAVLGFAEIAALEPGRELAGSFVGERV